MTTGAIYHQFGDKLGLFRAVAEDVEREILAGVVNAAARAPASDRRGAITAGIEGMLDAVMAPDVQRIAFVEAPTVLGVRAWREIEARYAYGLLFDALSELEQAGSLKGLSATAVAPMILGALNEAATTIATSSNKKAARDASLLAIRRILEGIVGPPGTS